MTEYTKTIVNVITGEQTVIPLTPEEIYERENQPTPPVPIPESITRRQCSMQLMISNMITAPEAIVMAQSGTPPASIATYFDAMAEPQRTYAYIDFAATNYYRNNPLIADLMSANGLTTDQIDQFFIDAGGL